MLVLLAPPLVSTDVFSYQAYARMGAIYGTNPYLHGPYAITLDPVYPYIGANWFQTPSAYGPLFTVFSYAFATLSIAPALWLQGDRGAPASPWSRSSGTARACGAPTLKAVALVGLNPLLIVYGVGGGHNDLLMLLP